MSITYLHTFKIQWHRYQNADSYPSTVTFLLIHISKERCLQLKLATEVDHNSEMKAEGTHLWRYNMATSLCSVGLRQTGGHWSRILNSTKSIWHGQLMQNNRSSKTWAKVF